MFVIETTSSMAPAAEIAEIIWVDPKVPEPVTLAPLSERRHGFDEAAAEYSRLVEAYSTLGYQIEEIPKTRVSERVDYILHSIESD